MPWNSKLLHFIITAVQISSRNTKKSNHHDDALADRCHVAVVRNDMGRVDPVLQPGAVRGQRVPAGVATVADPATSLHPVRFGLAPRQTMERAYRLLGKFDTLAVHLHKSSDFISRHFPPKKRFGAHKR